MKGKGPIEVGYDADLVVLDLEGSTSLTNANQRSRCGWTPFDGCELRGQVTFTIVGGVVKYRDGALHSEVSGQEVAFH
jgi:dihydroorotase